MENTQNAAIPELGKPKTSITNWKQFYVLNDSNKEKLVLNPKIQTYKHLMEAIEKHASLNDGLYVNVYKRLHGVSEAILTSEKAI